MKSQSMQYLIAIPLITGLVSLAISFWAAPRIKEELDQQGLGNAIINILSWRPHSRAYYSKQRGGNLGLDWIHPSKFELYDNKEWVILFQEMEYSEAVTKVIAQSLEVKEEDVNQIYDETLSLWYQKTIDLTKNEKEQKSIINLEEKSDNSINLWMYLPKLNTSKTLSPVFSSA